MSTHTYIPAYLTRRQVAEFYPISLSRISKLGMEKNRHKGPAIIEIDGSIIYRKVDIEAWLDSRVVMPSPPVTRGRPTKAEQIAKRGIGK